MLGLTCFEVQNSTFDIKEEKRRILQKESSWNVSDSNHGEKTTTNTEEKKLNDIRKQY